MNEVEVKILEINQEDVEKKLKEIGARKIFEGEINALSFDFEDRTLENAGDLLRLRSEGEKAVLTLKKFVEHDSVKIRKEYEVEVSDINEMKALLENLGFKARGKGAKKYRIAYAYKDVHFVIDRYMEEFDFIPVFLEIETEDVGLLYEMVELLGFKKEDCKAWSFKDLKKHYRK
jgi:adenylate cyclase class 2